MKEITITIPDNCELKQDGNIYTIVEEEKKVTYQDVIKGLYPHSREKIMAGYFNSEKHIQKLITINKLINVAKYLNGDWKPNWNNTESKYTIGYWGNNELIPNVTCISYNCGIVYFKSKELAKQAIEILGEETIKLALCTDY